MPIVVLLFAKALSIDDPDKILLGKLPGAPLPPNSSVISSQLAQNCPLSELTTEPKLLTAKSPPI